jgi:hypothetical protein
MDKIAVLQGSSVDLVHVSPIYLILADWRSRCYKNTRYEDNSRSNESGTYHRGNTVRFNWSVGKNRPLCTTCSGDTLICLQRTSHMGNSLVCYMPRGYLVVGAPGYVTCTLEFGPIWHGSLHKCFSHSAMETSLFIYEMCKDRTLYQTV